jgi:ABC-type transport system involved in cytochrome c biogenesis permease component
MTPLALVWHQFRFDQKVFWRSPASVFFTVMLPVIFLLIFATIFGNDTLGKPLSGVKTTTYYVPAILTLAVVSATLVNLAINLTVEREDGVLKRSRGTPMPSWAFIAGRIGNSLVITAVMLVLITLLGHFVYGVAVPFARAGGVLVTLAIGAASCCPSTSCPGCSSPRPRSPTASSTSRASSRSAPSSRRSSRPGCQAAGPSSSGATSGSSRCGGSPV